MARWAYHGKDGPSSAACWASMVRWALSAFLPLNLVGRRRLTT